MPGGGDEVKDVDRAEAGVARGQELEKKGAGGLRLQVEYNAVQHAYEVLGCTRVLGLKCGWRFSEKFPYSLNYNSRIVL